MTTSMLMGAILNGVLTSGLHGHDIQLFGTAIPMSSTLSERVRQEGVTNIQPLLTGTVTLRNLVGSTLAGVGSQDLSAPLVVRYARERAERFK